MPNPTLLKFKYPDSLIREYEHWVVLLRPSQVTLGSLVLAARSEATAFSELPKQAFAELAEVVAAIEKALGKLCDYERVNYLMLMMVDPNVHFHVIPRYPDVRTWQGVEFPDLGWPGPPQLKIAVELDDQDLRALRDVAAALF